MIIESIGHEVIQVKRIDFMLYFQPANLLPPANEVWGKVIFSEECVKNSVHKGGVSALPGGVCSGGCLLWGVSALGGVCPRCLLQGVSALGVSAPGVSALGGVCSGGCVCLRGVWWRHAPRILLRAVCILLECILV